jgi:hypothetical protein
MSDDACGCGPASLACTLGPADFRQRLAQIRALAGRALQSAERDDLQLRLSYRASAGAAVRQLVELERACCSFLDFRVENRDGAIAVTITAPPAARGSIEEIFAEFAATSVP